MTIPTRPTRYVLQAPDARMVVGDNYLGRRRAAKIVDAGHQHLRRCDFPV